VADFTGQTESIVASATGIRAGVELSIGQRLSQGVGPLPVFRTLAGLI